ncbi:hypothetical protein AX14_000947 [Amanita brunnescens Koide BX004]|nr:hypothetical protein AX14_000947 [Amanita brunnescens Koide BX004]
MKEDTKTIPQSPLWLARLTALGLAWSWAIVAVGINALVKSNQLKAYVKHVVPSPTLVVINDNDIFQAGVVATSISAVIAVLCTLLILLHLRGPLSSTALRVQGASLGFCAVWLFSVLVPLTQFYRTRSAIVDASIGGVSLPDEAVQTVERALGLTNRYKDLFFLRLLAILPWFAFLFTTIASVLLFVAASRIYRLEASRDSDLINKGSTTSNANPDVA